MCDSLFGEERWVKEGILLNMELLNINYSK